MRVAVKKWGNSASIRIPAAIMAASHLQLNDLVDIREEHGYIIIEPLHMPKYDLSKLLSKITKKNRHSEIEFGEPMGKEPF